MGRGPEGPEGSSGMRNRWSSEASAAPSAPYDRAPPHLNGEECACGVAGAWYRSTLRQTREWHMADFDLVVRGGTVADGTGTGTREADVAVKDGKIAAVGKVTGTGAA